MASKGSSEQFLCSICLEVFTDPVSTPCGHNFCKTCITQTWDSSAPCRCPLCNKRFDRRPELNVNTLFSEMVSQFKFGAKSDSMEKRTHFSDVSSPVDVLCDVCPEPKLKALRSCLVCLLSYCPLHLEPHGTVSRLKRHPLIEPVDNLEERMCPKHDKPLELFCRSEGVCVCTVCPLLEHKNHELVSLKEESHLRRSSLQQTQAQTQLMVEQRRVKIQEIGRSLELSQKAVDRERTAGLKVFTDLILSVQRRQEEFIQELQEKHKQTQKQAQDLISELEKEICELQKTSSDIEQLTGSEDHFHFLQRASSIKTSTNVKDWSQVRLNTPSYERSVDRAVEPLQKTLNEKFNKEKVKLWRLQQWAIDVTLDPDTVHPDLVLSKDLKQVYHSGVKKALPDNSMRFTAVLAVLGKQSFSSGKFYFEVQVNGKTKWDLGVVKESINRKKSNNYTPQNGFWLIVLRDGDKYKGCVSPSAKLSLASVPERIGVFVDYEQGLVSFYDVDSAAHIFSFTGCTFTEKIYPYFSPYLSDKGKNSAPLIIMSVDVPLT